MCARLAMRPAAGSRRFGLNLKRKEEQGMMGDTIEDRLRFWQEQGHYEAIIEAITALDAETDYELTLWLALAYNRQYCYDEAIAALMRAESAGEHDPQWHAELGRAYFGLEQDDLALAQFEEALVLDRNQEPIWQLLEQCTKRSGLLSALEDRLRPDNWAALQQKEAYTEEELYAVKAHIRDYYGPYQIIGQSIDNLAYTVEILLIEPTEERPFYTMMTLGMGAHRMIVPEPLKPSKLDRAELMICLPPEWPVEESDDEWQWPVNWLKTLAYLPLKEGGWLGWGHTVPGEETFSADTQQCAVILCDPCAVPKEAALCPLPDGNEINFYQLIPLYEEELRYKLEQGAEALFDRFGAVDHVVDLKRPNTCSVMPHKRWAIPEEAMKPLLNQWQAGENALATDRIIVDGLPVGYMYREEPVEEEPTDSGWRFMAGDETEEYMSVHEHFGVYPLNVLCNYDPEIMPYLLAPSGSAFYRDEQGKLQADNERQEALMLTFAQRVENFWQWFIAYEPLLQTIMAHPEQYRSQDVVALISEGTNRLADDVQFNVNGDYSFFFLADGDFCRFYLMPYVVAKRPDTLNKKWTFWPWVQPTDFAQCRRMGMPERFLALENLQVSLQPSAVRGKFDVRFFHQDLLALGERECYSTFYLLLELNLGEALAYLYINDAQRAQALEADMFPLAELGTKICARILDSEPTVDTIPSEHWVSYERTPRELEALRFDVVSGETNYPALIKQYYQNQTLVIASIAAYGAQAVYLTYDHDGQLSLAEQTKLRQELTRRLLEEILGKAGSGQEIGIILGGASGEKRSYVDLLLYDTPAFLASAGVLLKEYPYTFYLAPFYQNAKLLEIDLDVERQ